MPVPTPKCQGYILAAHHPASSSDAPKDPYAVVPCPHPPVTPSALSDQCALSIKKKSCKRLTYCEMHHCGACKKSWKDALAKQGKVMTSDHLDNGAVETEQDRTKLGRAGEASIMA